MNILIIGGSSLLGKELALTFAPIASNIILLGRNSSKLSDLAKLLNNEQRVHLIECDLVRVDLIDLAITWIESRFSAIDIIFNVAGGSYVGGTEECEAVDFFSMVDSYIKGQTYFLKKMIPLMRNTGDVLLINFLADWVTRKAGMECGNALYTMTKAALAVFCDCLASEEHGYGLRVSNIYLGQISEAESLEDLERSDDGVADLLFMQDICDFVRLVIMSESLHVADVVLVPKSPSYARTRLHTNSPKHDI